MERKVEKAVKYMISVWDEVTGKSWRNRPDHVQEIFLDAETELNKPKLSVKKTENCVICGSFDTIIVGGHIHGGKKMILASFCKKHMDIDNVGRKNCPGCYGDKMSFVKISKEPYYLDNNKRDI